MQEYLNFKNLMTSNNGLWQSSLCIDCKTDVLHTENDTTYTFITILKKNMGETFTTTSDHTSFLFQLNAKNNIGIQLHQNISFMYSGKYLLHRQHSTIVRKSDKGQLVNIACYRNEQLSNHLRTTFDRKIK